MTSHSHSLKVFTDDRVSSAILDIIRSAKDHIILVSPYNKFWEHLKDEIRLAIKRRVLVTIVYREGEDETDINWLTLEGAKAIGVSRLHAKIFLNESEVLIDSMNLLETSSKNSKEIGLSISGREEQAALREYVLNRLIPLGKEYPVKRGNDRSPTQSQISSGLQATTPRKKPIKKQSKSTGASCIRCGLPIPYDINRPLCEKDYLTWSVYYDDSYPEVFCHACGNFANTSYLKPLCYDCFLGI